MKNKRTHRYRSPEKIFSLCEAAAKEMGTFYQKRFVQYSYTFDDETEGHRSYSDEIAEFLLTRNLRSEIKRISRKEPYDQDHQPIKKATVSTRIEAWVAKAMFTHSYNNNFSYNAIGTIIDYETPLCTADAIKGIGKIDLLALSPQKDMLYLIELKLDKKRKGNKKGQEESLLRAVLEIFTYSRIVTPEKLKKDFAKKIKNAPVQLDDMAVVPVVAIFKNGKAHKQLTDCPVVIRLINELEVKIALLTGNVAKQGEDPSKTKIEVEWWQP